MTEQLIGRRIRDRNGIGQVFGKDATRFLTVFPDWTFLWEGITRIRYRLTVLGDPSGRYHPDSLPFERLGCFFGKDWTFLWVGLTGICNFFKWRILKHNASGKTNHFSACFISMNFSSGFSHYAAFPSARSS